MGFLDQVTKMLASGGGSSAGRSGSGAGAAGALGSMSRSGGKAGMAAALLGQYMQAQQGQQGQQGQAAAQTSAPSAPSVDPQASARCCNRVALLNVAGWRDGDFSPAERLILFRYVLATNDLSAEAKVELLKEMDKPPEQIGDFWQKAKDNLSREQLFADDAQAQEFSQTLEALVKSDGELDENEVSFVRMVRQTCGI